MPHPIYGKPSHDLEVIYARLWLPSRRNGRLTRLTLTGEASTARSHLWSYQETWTAEQQEDGLQPVDTLHQIVLATSQDRPVSQEGFSRSILPGGWENQPLPF